MADYPRRTYVPALFIPVMYVWYSVEPGLLWLIYSWRRKRVAGFLRRANNLRMRQKRIEKSFPRLASRRSRFGDSDVSIDG